MFDLLFASVQPDSVSLDAGPEFYNCGGCPHNCVGGTEAGCPTPAPVPPPKPASWYMATDTPQLASQTQSLESGPEFYNCGSCPHNCVGGSEAGCPTPAAVPPPKPSSWYCSDTAQLAGTQTATPTQSLDGGAEFYNCWSCSHNCVGGSEQGCIPSKPEASVIVHDPSKMGQLAMPVAAAIASVGTRPPEAGAVEGFISQKSVSEAAEDGGGSVLTPFPAGSVGDGEFDFRPFFLSRARADLYDRIAARCEEMVSGMFYGLKVA